MRSFTTEPGVSKRPKMCDQKLHIGVIYDIHSHCTIRFTLLYCSLSEFLGTRQSRRRAGRRLCSSKSVVWEHSGKKELWANVVLLLKPQIGMAQLDPNLTGPRIWVEQGYKPQPRCPLPLTNATKVKAQYKPLRLWYENLVSKNRSVKIQEGSSISDSDGGKGRGKKRPPPLSTQVGQPHAFLNFQVTDCTI